MLGIIFFFNTLLIIYKFRLDLNVNMGQLTSTSLSIPGDIPRVCKLYSSHPLTVYFPSPFDKAFALAPGFTLIILNELILFILI